MSNDKLATCVADLVQTHAAALHDVLSALLSIPTGEDMKLGEVADNIYSVAEKHKMDSKELLGRAISKAVVDVLKGGICHDISQANIEFRRALSIVDVSIALMRLRRVEEKLPCTLLEFVFTFCTRGQLSSSVNLIRSRFAAYRAASPSSKMDLFLIKTAVSCINRDQKGSDPELSGRLRLMLASALPVWHPSGMNRRGTFNTANENEYENALKESDCEGVDISLYKSFWGVQSFMRNPSLGETTGPWADATSSMDTVLSAFETLPCPAESPMAHDSSNPKYMTAGSILRLQMVDIRVRRHVLMQFLIFLHHLQVVGESHRSEKDTAAALAKAKFCKSLFEEGAAGDVLKVRIYKLLDKDSSGKFRRFISSLLQREKRWIDWKKHRGYKHLDANRKEAPKSFKRRAVLAPYPNSSKPLPKKRKQNGMESDWKTRQSSWKILPPSERMGPLTDPDRCPVPSLKDLKDELREDMNDPEVTEDSKRKNDTKYLWRSLRMLCEESVDTLSQVIDLNSKRGYNLEISVSGAVAGSPQPESALSQDLAVPPSPPKEEVKT